MNLRPLFLAVVAIGSMTAGLIPLAEAGAAETSPVSVSSVPGAPGLATAFLPLAQLWPEFETTGGLHDIQRGPGGYFSWIKLSLVVLVFFIWVKLVESMNLHAIKFSEHTGQVADNWNPIAMFCFLAGLAAVFAIPVFAAGFPVFVLAAFLPWGIYQMMVRGLVPDSAVTGELFNEEVSVAQAVPIQIKPTGSDPDDAQGRLILARQSPQFEAACHMLHDSFQRRVDQILLNYTRDAVNHRVQVDGLWHQMPAMDRETGDGILAVMKNVAGLNPGERRQKQNGQFNAKVGREKIEFDLASQGVKTGEQVLVKITRETGLTFEMASLGMNPPMVEKLFSQVSSAGMVIVSAPAGQGLTATWHGLLNGADRFTRDFVGVSDFDDRETARENVGMQQIDSRKSQSAAEVLSAMILKEPHVFVMPKIADQKTMDLLVDQVGSENRTVLTRTQAGSAVEAILRLMALTSQREQFVNGLTMVTCQRLVRQLCDQCKQTVPANPKAVQQMGGNPAVHKSLYKDYQLPPVEARVDASGKPVEMQPCSNCSGIGFQGRTAIYEMLVLNQPIRDALLRNPKPEIVSQVARQQGNLSLIQQAYQAVLEGRTSMSEVQRVFQPAQAAPRRARQ